MALDKQRILSELGSVMNQLQSADCGCMGKLFNSGQENIPTGSSLPTCSGCRHGCCRGHGYGVHYNNGDSSMSGGGMCRNGMGMGPGGGMGAGGGMAMGGGGGMGMGAGGMGMGASGTDNMGTGGRMNAGMNQGYMGMNAGGIPMSGGGMGMPNNKFKMNSLKDTAPRLYSETYNYLNQNLMRPVVHEMYQDLKSLTPENSVGNNPLVKQIPALSGAGLNPALLGANSTGPDQNQGMLTGAMASTMDHNAASGEPMKNMGNEILNMMMSRRNPNANAWGATAGGAQGGPGKGESMLIDAPQSPHGQIGLAPYSPATGANDNKNTNSPAANMGMRNAQMVNPTTHYVTQDNMYSLPPEANVYNNTQGNAMQGNMAQNINPGIQNSTQPMRTAQNAGLMNSRPGVPPSEPNNYSPHSLGMRTFQNIFPGIAEGDLGFDPMAIAIQMNPANQKRAAMDNINKFMNNQPRIKSNILQPAVQGSNAMPSQLPKQQQQDPGQINAPAGQQNLTANQQLKQNVEPNPQGRSSAGQIGQIGQEQQQAVNPGGLVPQNQQIYTALSGTPTINQPMQQQQTPQQLQGQVHPQQLQGQTEYQQGQTTQQQMIDPATRAPLNYTTGGELNTQIQNQGMIKETLYPADTSKNTVAYAQPDYAQNYNTLGQPINLERADKYHIPIPPLPQTLSPQDPRVYENSVKNTLSKTSLAPNRVMGQAPSKSQLRHIYRQYKAGHAGMQQSIRPPQGGSQSDGKLYPPGGVNAQINYTHSQAPIERVGGDTAQNVNRMHQPMSDKPEQNIEQLGDLTRMNKPQGDIIAEKVPMMQSNGKNRNGLQDMRFTKYINTNGWSFHG